jgi:hypothetical protein
MGLLYLYLLPQLSIWTLGATDKFVIGSVAKYLSVMVKI